MVRQGKECDGGWIFGEASDVGNFVLEKGEEKYIWRNSVLLDVVAKVMLLCVVLATNRKIRASFSRPCQSPKNHSYHIATRICHKSRERCAPTELLRSLA